MKKLQNIMIIILFVVASLAFSKEYKMPDEIPYQPIVYPEELLNSQSGYILDFLPSTWKEIDLSGIWKLKRFPIEEGGKDFEDPGLKDAYYNINTSIKNWEDIVVPWSLSFSYPEMKRNFFNGVAWYQKIFNLPDDWRYLIEKGWRVIIRFYGVFNKSDVWINGKKAGQYISRANIFQYDITDKINISGGNILTVRVFTSHKGYRYRHHDGIWQPVKILCIPPIYAKRILVAPHINPLSLDIQLHIVNWKQSEEKNFRAYLIPFHKEGKKQIFQLGRRQIKKGESILNFQIKPSKVKLWSPKNPNLYFLVISDGENIIGKTRFGFRTFEVKNGHFYLNGKRIKLMGLRLNQPNVTSGKWGCNNNNYLRKLLYALKQANINFIRPHCGGGLSSQTFYNLCDEEGMMVYDEYHYLIDYINNLAERKKEYIDWVLQNHNHPSVIMWDHAGNELYNDDLDLIPILNSYYDLLKKIDLQKRPVTSSSGRLTAGRMLSLPVIEKVDFVDSHCYPGFSSGSYQELIKRFKLFDEATKKVYGNIPKVSCEYGFPCDVARYRRVTREIQKLYQKDIWGKEEKEKYIEFITSKKAEIGGYLRLKGNWVSAKAYVTNPTKLLERASSFMKKFLEIFRRSGDIIDGGHMNTSWYDLVAYPSGGYDGIVFPAISKWLGIPNPLKGPSDTFYTLPPFYTYRRVYNEQFICLDIYNKNVFSGNKWEAICYIMNDSSDEYKGTYAVIQLRNPDKKMIIQKLFWKENLNSYTNYKVPIELNLPSNLKTGFYRIELFLLDKNKKHLSDNSYPVFIVNKEELPEKIISKNGKVALYDKSSKIFAGFNMPSTTQILDALNIQYTLLNNFENLKKYNLLIIGANSIDGNIIKNGDKIRKWVKEGGRVLCFEQNMVGPLPFFPEVSVCSGNGATFTEILVPNHPIFKGLTQDNFNDWDGNSGLLFRKAFSPLNIGMLSVGPTTNWRRTDSFKMVSAAYRLGKGEIILSAYDVTSRYGKDSVATKYTQNLLTYILTQPISNLSLPIESEKVSNKFYYLEKKNAYFVNLKNVVNRGFAGGRHSWADFGKGVGFSEIPTGITTLSGRVPFNIINPETNHGLSCLVLKGARKNYFPEYVKIPVNQKLKKLYFLHTSMYANEYQKGKEIYTVYINCKNGEKRKVTFRNKIDIGDWWRSKNLKNSIVVFTAGNKNLFLTEIPLSKNGIFVKDITLKSAGKAIPIIIAITGELAREK